MRKTIAAALTVIGIAAMPAGAASASGAQCLVTAADLGEAVCYRVDVGCVVGTLRGYQYLQPCAEVRVIRP